MKSNDSARTGETWDSIRQLRSADPNERRQATSVLTPESIRRANGVLRFSELRLPQVGDTGALTAALLRFASAPASYPDRSVVFMEGQDAVGVWLLCSGRVRLCRSSAAGKNVTLRMAHAGEALGLSAVLSHDSLRMAAQTAEPCTLAFLDRAHLFRLIRNPEISSLVMEALSREVQATYSCAGDLMLARSARTRIARILLSTASEDLRSHSQISELAGCSRETVTRLLGLMQRDELIAYEDGKLRLLDEAGIQAMCE
jgi:CRP/FNR family transcriptional regulator, cyclic AMP receptor protein